MKVSDIPLTPAAVFKSTPGWRWDLFLSATRGWLRFGQWDASTLRPEDTPIQVVVLASKIEPPLIIPLGGLN